MPISNAIQNALVNKGDGRGGVVKEKEFIVFLNHSEFHNFSQAYLVVNWHFTDATNPSIFSVDIHKGMHDLYIVHAKSELRVLKKQVLGR